MHPLSPCYRTKPGAELLYVHPQPGGIGYQHWLGLLSRNPGPLRHVAPSVDAFRDRVRDIHRGADPWRLLAAGYDMDNMKARGFAESEMPVVEPRDPEAARTHEALLGALVRGAEIVAGLLARCVRRAWFGDGASVAIDAAPIAALRERFWANTADAFFIQARDSASGMEDAAARTAWRSTLGCEARTLFNEATPVDASGEGHPGRVAAAARQLGVTLAGYGKEGEALFTALGLDQPDSARKAKTRRKETAA